MNFNLNDFVTVEQFQGFVRHAMTTVGGVAVFANNFQPDQWQTIVGAAGVIAGVVWSYVAKKTDKPTIPPVAPTAPAPVVEVPAAAQ